MERGGSPRRPFSPEFPDRKKAFDEKRSRKPRQTETPRLKGIAKFKEFEGIQ
jgi:hypothetical protein